MKIERITEHKQKLFIHQSDLATARMCQEQLRLAYVGELYEPDSDSAMIGTLTHKFQEQCLRHFKANGFWPDADELFDWVRELQEELAGLWDSLWLHPHQVKDLADGQEALEGTCVKWFQNMPAICEAGNADEWLIEFPFDIRIGTINGPGLLEQTEVHLRGHFDFWTGTRVRDLKTGVSREDWRKERYDIQSTVYTYAASVILGRPVNDFVLDFCPRESGSKGGFKSVAIHRSEGQQKMMIKEALAVARLAMKTDLTQPWPLGPTDWWCSERWCSHYARGKCMGEHQSIYPDETVHLTDLIKRGVQPRRHDATFDHPLKGTE